MKQQILNILNEGRTAIKTFSHREKMIFLALLVIFAVSAVGLIWKLNERLMVETPAHGGSLTEGTISSPRFINPLLSISDADRDMSALIYSGLLKLGPDGTLAPDLAEKYDISDDGLTYTFTLRDNIFWHDGEKVTTDDVEFTVHKAQDPGIKSPRRANWEGVKVEKVDEKTVKFVLSHAYSPFIENATLGILSRHIWGAVTADEFAFSQFNIEPIGSGPYKISKVKRNSSGITSYYDLTAFNKYALGKPFIADLTMRFYPNEGELASALRRGEVSAASALSPESVSKLRSTGFEVVEMPLSRLFGIFFNQNQNKALTDVAVRRALAAAIDKKQIVQEVLHGYGVALDGPLPPETLGYKHITETTDINPNEILSKAGWKINKDTGVMEKKVKKETLRLEITLTTVESSELKEVADIVRKAWEAIGAKVTVNSFELSDLNQNIIRPRKYDALLFGEILGHDPDPYAFWHSSQRNDPGLNIALYTNSKVDKYLEDARKTHDAEKKISIYGKFQDEVRRDVPAIFLYSPHLIYVVPKELKGLYPQTLATASERFSNINNWYVYTNKIWKAFAR